jgi:crossover junction endodeoxyribonuclease RusA
MDWREEAGWEIKQQVKGRKITGEYTLKVVAVKPDKRRRDLGNLEKAISDLLQEVGVIEDDYLCQEIHLMWADTGPDCLIIIRKYENGETI